MNDQAWRELRLKVKGIGERRVKVGVLGGTDAKGISMPELAAIHEFGAPAAGIPQRSFIRFTAKNRADDIAKMCERLARGILGEKLEVDHALGLLGAFMVGAIRKSITQRLIKQDLAPATIVRKTKGKSGKRGTAALIDTGQLINSLSFAVEEVAK